MRLFLLRSSITVIRASNCLWAKKTTELDRELEFASVNVGRAHYIMVSKIQWKPFWLATQIYPQNDWTWVAKWCELWRMRTDPIGDPVVRKSVPMKSLNNAKLKHRLMWWKRTCALPLHRRKKVVQIVEWAVKEHKTKTHWLQAHRSGWFCRTFVCWILFWFGWLDAWLELVSILQSLKSRIMAVMLLTQSMREWEDTLSQTLLPNLQLCLKKKKKKKKLWCTFGSPSFFSYFDFMCDVIWFLALPLPADG